MSYVGKITAGGVTSPIASTLYGTCNSESGVVAKVVTCADFDQLITGVTIHVKFTYGTWAENPTLNVNNTGAKNIIGITSWQPGSVISFTYDGTNWCMNNNQVLRVIAKGVIDSGSVSIKPISTNVPHLTVITNSSMFKSYYLSEVTDNRSSMSGSTPIFGYSMSNIKISYTVSSTNVFSLMITVNNNETVEYDVYELNL